MPGVAPQRGMVPQGRKGGSLTDMLMGGMAGSSAAEMMGLGSFAVPFTGGASTLPMGVPPGMGAGAAGLGSTAMPVGFMEASSATLPAAVMPAAEAGTLGTLGGAGAAAGAGEAAALGAATMAPWAIPLALGGAAIMGSGK